MEFELRILLFYIFTSDISIFVPGMSFYSVIILFAKAEAVEPSDSTYDVYIFGALIAPELNITLRFVGEEPHCIVTKSYNERLNFLLPHMGVTVKVIPRVTYNGECISASKVRAAMKPFRAIDASNNRFTASKPRLSLFGGKDLKQILVEHFKCEGSNWEYIEATTPETTFGYLRSMQLAVGKEVDMYPLPADSK